MGGANSAAYAASVVPPDRRFQHRERRAIASSAAFRRRYHAPSAQHRMKYDDLHAHRAEIDRRISRQCCLRIQAPRGLEPAMSIKLILAKNTPAASAASKLSSSRCTSSAVITPAATTAGAPTSQPLPYRATGHLVTTRGQTSTTTSAMPCSLMSRPSVRPANPVWKRSALERVQRPSSSPHGVELRRAKLAYDDHAR